MLNSQPLGFYTPAQLIADAQRHGVEVLPVDLNSSLWECTLEKNTSKKFAIRLGLCMVRGLRQNDGLLIASEKQSNGRFKDQSELVRRCRLGQAVLAILAERVRLHPSPGTEEPPTGKRSDKTNPTHRSLS